MARQEPHARAGGSQRQAIVTSPVADAAPIIDGSRRREPSPSLKERIRRFTKAPEGALDYSKTWISVRDFYTHVCKEKNDEMDLLSILLTVLMAFCFAVTVIGMLAQEDAFSVQEAVTNDIEEDANFAGIHKIFRDAHSVADFWSWP